MRPICVSALPGGMPPLASARARTAREAVAPGATVFTRTAEAASAASALLIAVTPPLLSL